jgi:hypothetical protein
MWPRRCVLMLHNAILVRAYRARELEALANAHRALELGQEEDRRRYVAAALH